MADDPVLPTPRPADRELTYLDAEATLRKLAGQQTDPANGPPAFPVAPLARTPAAASGPDPSPAPDLRSLTGDALRGLIDAVPDGLVVVDPSGRIVLVNTRTEQLFGYRHDDLIGRPLEVLVPERFRERHVFDREQFFVTLGTRVMGVGSDLVGRRHDGTEIPVEISLSPLTADDGTRVVASVRDVSVKRQADAHLRKVEARYRTLIERIPAVTFVAAMDEEANELYVSPQIEQLLGFTQQEWLEDPIL